MKPDAHTTIKRSLPAPATAPIVAAIFAALLSTSANASALGPLSGSGWDASAFNVVTLGVIGGSNANAGNFAPSSDVGGAVAVFGNYTGNGYAINQQYSSVPNPYTETYALIVNGNIATNPFSVDGSNPSVYVGGTHSANNFNGSPTIAMPPNSSDFNFLSARTALDSLSTTTLGSDSAAVTITPSSNGTNYVATPTGSGTFVYNVDASFFTNQNLGFEVDVVTGQTAIINVTGSGATNLTLSKGTVVKLNGSTVNANTTGGVPVLFNFANTTSLGTSNGIIDGSILAPYATFSSPNQDVDGQLFVASVNGLAETHDQYFDGTLPAISSTPEPGTFVMLGGVLLVVGLARRKSRRK